MIKSISKVLIGGLIFASAISATAAESTKKEDIANFLADCGIGGAIFKHDVGGVLSNIIWDFGLTATTSFVSSPETCEGVDVAAAEFIHQTYVNLTEETAAGEGAHLATLMDLYACDGSAEAEALSTIRSQFSGAVNESSYGKATDQEKAQTYFTIVKSSVASCQA
ncbi:DUF3015 family protein [Teredinibacter haidensis]|uniref:DUF3015 family protein n=1 Tax=Teredinibacter haidensis TaxID=2731755 RepID=UPI00094907C8|nr:DUF3015 family protein [Teredinibacter haidensis]